MVSLLRKTEPWCLRSKQKSIEARTDETDFLALLGQMGYIVLALISSTLFKTLMQLIEHKPLISAP